MTLPDRLEAGDRLPIATLQRRPGQGVEYSVTYRLACAAAFFAFAGDVALTSSAPAQQQTHRFDYNEAIKRARDLLRDNDTATATQLLTEAIAREPSQPEAYRQRATAYASSGNFEAALKDNAEAMHLQPDARSGYTERAFLLRMLGRDEEALEELRKLASRTTDPSALQSAAIYLAKYERYTEVDDALAKLASIGGDRGQILVLRAQNYKPDAVPTRLADFERGLAAKPDYVFGFEEWGDLLRRTGNHAKAVTVYTRGLARDGNDATMLAGREASYRILGDTARADKDAAALLRLKDRWYASFMVCRAKGEANIDLNSALSACEAALAEHPKSPGILHDRGMVLFRQQRFADAIATFDQTLAIAPFLPDPLFARALAKKALGDDAGATIDAALALRIDPRTEARFKVLGLTL